MTKYYLCVEINASAVIEIEAADEKSAREKYESEFEDGPVNICHQCADDIDEPTYAKIMQITKG